MIATDILEALWKQKKLIALFVAIAVLACYFCLFAGQNHTATVYIKYLEERAVEGIAADGTNLNPYEIAEPFIVEKTLAQLGKSNLNANAVAQRIKVTPVISSAEQEKYASWIDQFSNYDNTEDKKPTPVYYRIEFHSKEGVVFAQKFLNTLLQQYRAHYTQQYAGISEIAQISEVVVLNADYFYATEMLQEQIENTVSYLGSIASGDVDYRSPQTGYSLNDLIDAYNLLIETKVAPTMQYILDTGVSKQVSTLVAGLRQSSNAAQRDSDENADKADTQKQMMQLYAEKNKEYVSTVISPEDYDEQIFGNVERDKAYIRKRMSEYYPKLKDKTFSIKNLMGNYGYDDWGAWVTCEGSIPQAIVAFLDGEDFEEVIRNAVGIGGDSDTIGAMAGGIAEAYYGVPIELEEKALEYLPDDLKGIYHAFRILRKGASMHNAKALSKSEKMS